MQFEILRGLEPEPVFRYFEQICAIPHGSGNTRAISDYLANFAQEQGLDYVQDEIGNVVMYAPGTCGLEDHAPLIIQGHMDMVCEKDADCPIDMLTQGVDVTHDDEFVFANGTTLGADNGIAVAYAMAIVSDKTIAHPPLEIVITVDEETGMDGAAGIDPGIIKGRRMLNLDSDAEGVLTVSCAGGIRSSVALPVQRRAVYGPCVRLTVDGLRSGHSGVDISKNLANANKVMGQLLYRVQQLMPICLIRLNGGAKDNVIPKSCQATMVLLGMQPERLNDVCEALQAEIRTQFDEPNALIYGDNVDALGGNALTAESTASVIALLNAAPNGVQKWSEDIPGLVQTSLNLGVVKLDEEFTMTFAVRSSVEEEKKEVVQRIADVAQLNGAKHEARGDYPGWAYRRNSALRDMMVDVYTKLYGNAPTVEAIHAGLECGFFCDKLPGLDCVAMGPTAYDIHTSRERLNIASTKRVWEYLLALLKCL